MPTRPRRAHRRHELYQKVAWAKHMESMGRKLYHKRFLSAEGCYSHQAMHTAGLRVKVANKQFVGLEAGDGSGDVYVLNGSLWLCEHNPERPVNVASLLAASPPACDLALPGVQHAKGSRAAFKVNKEGCGGWMPQEFRMCASHLKGSTHRAVLIEDAKFFAQTVEEAPSVIADGGRCKQGALFHMQASAEPRSDDPSPSHRPGQTSSSASAPEPPPPTPPHPPPFPTPHPSPPPPYPTPEQEWKKRWGDGSTAAKIEPGAAYDSFRLSPNGFHALH